jgi:RNA polymerase sigma factor (sigma-70 family)
MSLPPDPDADREAGAEPGPDAGLDGDAKAGAGTTSFHVRRALNADEHSLGWIIERFTPLLLAHARYRLGGRPPTFYDPEDLVNDVWFLCLPAFRPGKIVPRRGRFTPVLVKFLSTTLLRRYNDLMRKHVIGKPRRVEPVEPTPESCSDVVVKAGRSETARTVTRAIERLSADDREILVLRGMEQAPYALIAARLGVVEGTLRSRFHHALGRLRAALPSSIVEDLQNL